MSMYRDLVDSGQEYLAHFGILGMKWGKRNGPPYPLNSLTRTKIEVNKAKTFEKRITTDVKNACSNTSGELYGLNNRLKTKKSIHRKINLGKNIKDAVRYTLLSNDEDFVNNYFKFKNSLRKKGYDEIVCKNYFEDYKKGLVKHKSVQSNFKSKDGYIFEVQFHTFSSQNAKDKKIPLYEESRRENVEQNRMTKLIKEMEKLADEVPEPKNIKRIKSH